MPVLPKVTVAALSLCLSTAALAQGMLEIIPLRHRTVEQVLPALRPLLEPGGVLSGTSNQLIVRTSPRNVAEIRTALEAIDTPLRRLLILVRFDDAGQTHQRRLEASGTLRSGEVTISNRPEAAERGGVDVRVFDSRSASGERVDQRIQVLEGGRALISTGQVRPLRQRQIVQTPGGPVISESIVMQDIATGFAVVPHVAGNNVYLDIEPQRETPGTLPGSVHGQRAATTVRASLGEWFEIGGTTGARSRDDRGLFSSNAQSATESRRIWVKVEELRP
jgi:type II secretory pathway component GspD/PulD (secretin)